MRKAVLFASIVVASLLRGSGARADHEGRVRWAVIRGPDTETCPDREAFARAVAQRLGRDPFDAGALRSIELVLRRTTTGFAAQIFARETPDEIAAMREIVSPAASCATLADGVVLAVALAIDPDAPAMSGAPSSFATASSPPPASSDLPPAASSSPPPATSAGPLSLPSAAPPPETPAADQWDRAPWVTATAGVIAGPIPSPTAAFALAVSSRRWRAFTVGVGVLYAPESATSGGSFAFGLTALHFDGCLGTADGRWSARACFEVYGGLLHGSVREGFQPLQAGDHPWFAIGGSVHGGVRIVGPVSVELEAGPFVSVLRERFFIADELTPVFDGGLVGFSARLGVRVRLW